MTTGEDSPGRWDFFVSYTQADRAWAEWIAWILLQDDHQVLIQAWDFVPGSNWVQGMQAGTRDATRTIAVLSPDYLKSEFGGAEWQAAWQSDPDGRRRKLLIVRVADCDLPGLLAGVVRVDLFGLPEATAKARLRGMVSGAITGIVRPSTPPGFPGAPTAIPRPARFPGALPETWKVPARNPNFTDRDQELNELKHALAAGSAVTVHSVHGMFGVGKTQLAVEYAHAHATDYSLVWWIAAGQPDSIPQQFTDLAKRLDLDPIEDPEALQAQVRDKLRSVPGWLLIFDNADRANDIQPWLPTGPLPPGIPGHVIVTTLRGGFRAVGRVMDLEVIDLPDAVQLLRNRVPGLAKNVAKQVAEELGQLPLALEQAAAYMDRSQMPGQEYLELLRSYPAEMFPRRASRTVTISLDHIISENPEAVQLLGVCAYLAPEPIPLDLFTAHPGLLPEPLASAAATQAGFR